MLYSEERKKMCEIVKTMFDRFQTNAAGGNLSLKVSDEHFIMTPTLMSQNYRCDLSPFQILVVDKELNIIEGEGRLTREINMHMACYEENPAINCVIHAHAKESMVWASMGKDMPNITEATQKIGDIPCLDYRPATSPELAALVRETIAERDADKIPAGLLLERHGLVVADKSLEKAYDMVERIEYNAYVAYKMYLLSKVGENIDFQKDYHYNLDE
ncbi:MULTISPECIES: class II aldolase/adducin family protein [Oceanobacillus]|uniref:class II aldolase/adducin family protein n=1 Tax=Oceanobacillus TaxID=182709 RepID=UPI0012EE5E0E